MSQSAPRLTIGVLIHTANAFHRYLVRGATAYAYDRRMRVWIEQRDVLSRPGSDLSMILRTRLADGYMFQGHPHAALTAAFAETGKPAVALTWRPPGFTGPMIALDDHALGMEAGRHLLDRGLAHMGFIGNPKAHWVESRLAGFTNVLASAGCTPKIFPLRRPIVDQSFVLTDVGRRELRHWLRRMPKPAGLFMVDDFDASQIAQICAEASIAVPEEVAILGSDNDPFQCEISYPPLSSIRLPGFGIGFEAARQLDRMLAGEIGSDDIRLPPLGVAMRRSTELVAIEDPAMVAALRFIRDGTHETMPVATIAAAAGISRRALEQRFQKLLGRTPLDEIRRVRIASAQRLLLETDRPLADIARFVGFASDTSFCTVFRRVVGRSPGQYRAGR